MKEEDIRLELQHLIASNGFLAYHPPDDTPVATPTQINQIVKMFNLPPDAFGRIRAVLQPPTWKRETVSLSRPDIYGLHPLERSIVIEVKAIKPKKEVEPWLDPADISDGQRNWLDTWKYQLGGMCFLGLGTLEGTPRQAWLIPWDWWVNLEKNMGASSIDFKVTLSFLPKEFELDWVKGQPKNPWKLREDHPLVSLATPETDPYKADWKKQYSFRFTKKEDDGATN